METLKKLRTYIESEKYLGWDPYDGLNSKLFQALPLLRKIPFLRLVMIQGFKRCPFNLRPYFCVPKEYNSKGLGLILQGYCNLYRIVENDEQQSQIWGSLEELSEHIRFVAELLISLKQEGYSGACWGYNFDWQARLLFFFPKQTPTVVATSFCATALFEAYEILKEERWLEIALSSGDFILNDLHRTTCGEGFIFSYSPLKGNDTVFNASLLGARVLSYCFKYTKDNRYADAARGAIVACCEKQAEDGSWAYGMHPVQSWVDSFHTGYNLDSLQSYQDLVGDLSFRLNIEKGLSYYVRTFFDHEGVPNYYSDKRFPIDIHCPGQLFTTLVRTHKLKENAALAQKVYSWCINNMQSEEGFFYYQIKKRWSSKISYMRWSNAFMFMSLSYYLLERKGWRNE